MKKLITYCSTLMAASALSASAVTTELALVIDGSGSISPGNFTIQQNGYVNALNSLIPSRYGEVAIGVWQFSGGVQLEQATLLINNATDLATVTSAIAGMTQLGGLTDIAEAITTSAAALLGNAINLDRTVIDVSTDGGQSVAGNPATAAANAIAAGIDQVNGLGIGAGADLSWVPAAPDGQTFTATTFDEFEKVVLTKIGREINGTPDGGSLLPIFTLTVVGLMGFRRRFTR